MADVPLMNNPMTTAGDVIYGGASGAPTRLAVGTAGQVLKVNAGATAVEWGAASSSTFAGYPVVAMPMGMALGFTDSGATVTISSNNTADMARAAPVLIPTAMKLRSLWIQVQTNGSGAIEWGLFEMGSTATAATKVAGGSAAPGGTGWRQIAATSAPVDVAAGQYLLIIENPASNASTIYVYSVNAAPGFVKAWGTYTWDDTPDLTSGSWVDSTIFYTSYLEGDMNASGTRW